MLAPVPVPASDGSSIVEAKVDSRIALVARAKHINWERGRIELQQIYAALSLSQIFWPFHVPKCRTRVDITIKTSALCYRVPAEAAEAPARRSVVRYVLFQCALVAHEIFRVRTEFSLPPLHFTAPEFV